jgi:energy-coupling factor transport system permease protein
VSLSPVPSTLLLACVATTALVADRIPTVAVTGAVLLGLVVLARRPGYRLYVVGSLTSGLGVLVLSPFLAVTGSDVLWSGPIVPVLGSVDITSEELHVAALNGLRLTAAALAFAAYALLVDHDGLLARLSFARRSAFAAGLATRLLPVMQRDAATLVEALRGRGIVVEGVRGRARLVTPLVAGSLERALSLAEAMEARGFGRPGRTTPPRRPWTRLDRTSLLLGVGLVAGAVWL